MCAPEFDVIDGADLPAVSGGAIIPNAAPAAGITKSLAGGTWMGQNPFHANGSILEPLARAPAVAPAMSAAGLQQLMVLKWLMGR